MKACGLLVVICAVTIGQSWCATEPTIQPADEEIFRIYQEQGIAALTPEQRQRGTFWLLYFANNSVMTRMYNGVVVAEDFDSPELSLAVRDEVTSDGKKNQVALEGEWRIWNTDPMITVSQENGVLAIKGTSSIGGGLNFNGLVGRVYGNTDVVAIAQMRPVAPDEKADGFHVAMFHLCGSFPDIFNELCFGRERDGSVGWTHHYVGEPVSGQTEFPVLPPFGDEHDRFYQIKLEHAAATEMSRAWLKVDGTWKEIGEARPVIMSTAKVELKVNVPTKDVDVECYFDNCRIYPRPENHPVRFVVFASPMGDIPVEGVKLELFINGAEQAVATGVTDKFGRAALHLPTDVDYPAAARVRVTVTDGSTWEQEIERHNVEGLYPDSVWVIRLNGRELGGDEDWWKDILKQLDVNLDADAE